MGKTRTTFRDRLSAWTSEWETFRRSLRRADQERWDRLLSKARDYADAAGNQNPTDPRTGILVSIAMAQQRDIDRLEERVNELEARLDAEGE